MKVFSRQIYSYGYHISKLNNLKVIHDLYSQCLTRVLSKTTSFLNMEGVTAWCPQCTNINYSCTSKQRE